MYHHPWVSAVLGVGTNLVFLGSILLMSFASFFPPHSSPETPEMDGDTEGEDNVGEHNPEVPANAVVEATVSRRSAPMRLILKLWSILRTFLISSLKLSLLATLAFISYQAYLHETYNPSEIAEITYNEVVTMLDDHYHHHQDTYTSTYNLLFDFLNNISEDIMVQLLLVKVTFIILIVFVMSMTKYIVG